LKSAQFYQKLKLLEQDPSCFVGFFNLQGHFPIPLEVKGLINDAKTAAAQLGYDFEARFSRLAFV
jgi:hypothetical protein